MPNRIIKETICSSEKISSLTDFEFRLWVGLITQVDDAGRGDARPAIIKGRVFPLRERLTVKEIESALHGLAAKGCVSLYTVGGKPYFWFPTWGEHQRIRDCKPKYPGPEDQDEKPQFLTICENLPQVAADCGLNPIQSNPNTNPNPNTNDSAEPRGDSAPVILLPLNDGSEYPVFVEQTEEWAKLYPAVDVMQELREMRAWLQSNKQKRKTKRGILAFVTRWLSKEQDKGGRSVRNSNAPVPASAYSNVSSGSREKDDMDRMRRIMQGGNV